MDKILNITNGDCAVAVMKNAGVPGEFLPWRDVLNEGPVPVGLSLEELSAVRAEYIVRQGWGEADAIRQTFLQRDDKLKLYEKYEKVILWFEHDLYDQLQLLQLLDFFTVNRSIATELSIICVDRYLGELSTEGIAACLKQEERVTERQLQLASAAWSAFRADTPCAFADLLQEDTDALPYLRGAIHRLLEEYPACGNGLSRTASQALSLIAERDHSLGEVFNKCQELEERRFLGDWGFVKVLTELAASKPPLLLISKGNMLPLPASLDQHLSITPAGREVLAGGRNWLDFHQIDRWLGGVHLTPGNRWCWNERKSSIEKYTQQQLGED